MKTHGHRKTNTKCISVSLFCVSFLKSSSDNEPDSRRDEREKKEHIKRREGTGNEKTLR